MPNPLTISMDGRSRRLVIITSVVLILLGIIGIALPQLVSVTLALFVAWLMIIAGGLSLYSTWHGFRERWVVWLKPFILITFGLLILLHPLAATGALGLMLAVYFLLDGFAGVGAAWERRPQHGWGWIMVNGMLSLLLAAVFIVGWPFSSLWLIGLFIGISLLFDGISLLMFALGSEKR